MKASSSPSSETLTELGRRKDRLSVSPPWLAKRVILWRHWSVQSCPSYSASAAVSTCLSVVPAVFAYSDRTTGGCGVVKDLFE